MSTARVSIPAHIYIDVECSADTSIPDIQKKAYAILDKHRVRDGLPLHRCGLPAHSVVYPQLNNSGYFMGAEVEDFTE
jgi:hypothetical protein